MASQRSKANASAAARPRAGYGRSATGSHSTGRSPLVSVLTANHNGAAYLKAAVRSVLAQSLADLELILVDDASGDHSLAIIEDLSRIDDRIRVIRLPERGGPSVARNRGLALAKGRWIAVFDSDDLMAPDRLATLVATAEETQADIVVDNLIVFHDEEPDRGGAFLRGERQGRWITLEEFIGSSRMYSRRPGLGYLKPLISSDALRRLGVRYNEALRIGEDYDLVLNLLGRGCRMRLEPAALYRYRKHANSLSRVLLRADLERMIEADTAFDAAFPNLPRAVRRAQTARRRSLQAALDYDQVIASLKGRDIVGGLSAALASPSAWPLLTMPIAARMRRLRRRIVPRLVAARRTTAPA